MCESLNSDQRINIHAELLFLFHIYMIEVYCEYLKEPLQLRLEFEIVNFPFLDCDVPHSTSYGVYISQLIRFARASSHVADFNTCNNFLTQKLLKQGYRYHKLRKTFSKFYGQYCLFELDLNLSCAKDFRSLNSMVTWCIN